jgi:hypothetical protein
MRTVEADGLTLTIRERADITGRQRQKMEAAVLAALPSTAAVARKAKAVGADPRKIPMTGLSMDQIEAFQHLNNVAILVVLAGWSLDRPLPATVDELLDLPEGLFTTVSEAVAVDALMMVAETDFKPSNPRAPGFAETPTTPSVA